MGKFFGGFLLASSLAASAYSMGLVPPNSANCGGYCAEGTQCGADGCVPHIEAPPETETPQEDSGNKKKKRRRRSRGRGAKRHDSEFGAEKALPPFVAVNDRHVPRYNRKAAKKIDLDAGSERLSDRVINVELGKLDRRFQKCITTAVQYSDAEVHGRLDYELGVSGTGKVTGVNVRAPASLKVYGIVPCVRATIFKLRFPAFDGPTMGVESSFDVG